MAGLWGHWRSEQGEELQSCTIIVTEANELIRQIHDRMPVILASQDLGAWLDPDNQSAQGLLALLAPADSEDWMLQRVSREVNNPRDEGPELLAPAADDRS
jgi:putative SOS response-associated peptidase YedK